MANGQPPEPPSGITPPPPGPGQQMPPPPPPGQQQPVPGYQPQAPAPKKSSSMAKGCLIAAAIVAVIIVIIVVLLFTVIGVGVHKVVKEIEKTTKVVVDEVNVGQAGHSGALEVKVVNWTPSMGDEFSQPAAGNQFIVVDVEIRNTGSKTESHSTMLEMSIKTPDGYEYKQAAYFPDPQFPDGDILPGQTARGNVSFEVPSNIGRMNFVFDPVYSGKIVQVKLQ